MKTKVLFSALCLLVSISVCAGNKKAAKCDASTKQTKVVQVEDGNVVVVNTTESGKKCSTSVTVTRNGNEKRNNVYVVKSDGEATIATSLEAEVKPELPVLAPDSMPEFPGGMSAMMTYLMDNVKYPADAKKDKNKDGLLARL